MTTLAAYPQNHFMESKKIHRRKYAVRISELDHNRKMTPYAITQLMQEVGMQQTIEYGVATWDLGNHAWILIAIHLQVHEYPSHGDTITIETYPSGFNKIYAYRDYKMYNEKEELIASAASTWTYIDMVNNKVEKIPEAFLHLVVDDSVDTLPICQRRIKVPTEMEQTDSITIHNYDLDWNNHVNNNHYLRFILGNTPTELDGYIPASISIQYLKDAYAGDEILAFAKYSAPLTSHHTLVKKDGQTEIIRSLITWKSISQ